MATPLKPKALAILGLGLLIGASGASAQPSGASFLDVTSSARSFALGMSHGITALGAEALNSNPANLGLMSQSFEVFTSYASLLDSSQYEHFAAAFGLASGPLDGLGVSVTRLQIGGIQGSDSNGNATGSSFNSGDLAVGAGGSARLGSNLHAGICVKAVQSEIAGIRSNMALAGDVGLTFTFPQFGRPISIGVSATNLGQGIRFVSQVDPLPAAANLGVAFPLGPAMAVVEINRYLYDQRTEMGTGLEYRIGGVFFRAGYLAQNNAGNLALHDEKSGLLLGGLAGGVGLRVGALQLDYAISQEALDFGMTQRVGLTLRWGGAGRFLRAGDAADTGSAWQSRGDRSDWLLRPMGNY